VTVTLRPAARADVPFLVELLAHSSVRPYLAAVRPSAPAEVAAEIERAAAEPEAYGLLVIERDGRAAGTVSFTRTNRRSRIADLHSLAVHPAARSGGTAARAVGRLLDNLFGERGFHRVECEVYGFNDRAAAFFERLGFTREGARRRAYRHGDGWVDGIRFGLLAEEWHTRSGERRE